MKKSILPKYRGDRHRTLVGKQRGGSLQSGAGTLHLVQLIGTFCLGGISFLFIFTEQNFLWGGNVDEVSNSGRYRSPILRDETILDIPRKDEANNNNLLPAKMEGATLSRSLESTIGSTTSAVLLNDLSTTGYPEIIWENLLKAPSPVPGTDRSKLAVVEVGMHEAVQCLQAARAGFQAHCVEPSPTSFGRVKESVGRQSKDIQDRVHLYNVAAGSQESSVPFVASGGTGDHVGKVDMWKMETIPDGESDTKGTVIQVPSRRLDNILGSIDEEIIYLLKVDTQGFEPAVFSGLDDLLSKHRIQYILSEFWPRGMDVIAGEPDRACIGVKEILQRLNRYGYKLYALPVQAHPRAPVRGTRLHKIQASRPLDDFYNNCRWYYDVEEKNPSTEYKMGYWSDILAVSPNAEFTPEKFV